MGGEVPVVSDVAVSNADDLMLEVRDIAVSVGGRRILSEVSFSVGAGEWVTLVGPNGVGKSLLLLTLAGLMDARGVMIQGEPIAKLSVRERSCKIAYIPQQPASPAAMVVSTYVLLGRTPHLRPLGIESAEDLQICADVLSRLDLTELADRPLETLSGGELQRCHLARAIAQDTPVVILDEPTTALDLGHEQQALELIDEQRVERGLTVITAMHDLNAAARYSHRLVLLADGKVVANGTPDELLSADLLRSVYGAAVEVLRDGDGLSPRRGANLVVVPLRPERPE